MKHKNKKKKYFHLALAGRTADIYIFGDIVSWEYLESDVSSYTLTRAIQDLDVDEVNVHINSYGGEVAEGLAIHNSLKNHPARIRTVCDGFGCSAASVVFMAGDERVMNPASLLMIHNAWTSASGNARELRKAADDLDVISSAAAETYRARVNITEEQLTELLENETWIKPEDALAWGFATEILEDEAAETVSQSARSAVFQALTGTKETNTETPAGFLMMTGDMLDHTEEQLKRYAMELLDEWLKRSEMELLNEKTWFPEPPKQEENTLFTFLSALAKGGKE